MNTICHNIEIDSEPYGQISGGWSADSLELEM
jgi:hypothetical protein